MDDNVISGVANADLQQELDDLDFEGYAVIDKQQAQDGMWTIIIRKNGANGADQSADNPDATQTQEQQPEPPPPQARTGIGAQGEKLVKAFESCAKPVGGSRYTAYRDSVNKLTIGWGHTNDLGRQFDSSAAWTRQDCDGEFVKDMRVFARRVNSLVRVPLNQDQFDALISFCYNCGQGNLAKSTLLKKVNAGDMAGAAGEFRKWVNGGGRPLKGLVRRRGFEARLFRGIHDASFDGDPPSG
jgi:lysozyme